MRRRETSRPANSSWSKSIAKISRACPRSWRCCGAREMMEKERATAINPGEAVEEKVSLSDRFGLWLGFHRCSQDEYLAMVEGYVAYFRIPIAAEALNREALEWATTRGSRSGRVAWQYVQDLAGRLGGALED